MPININATWSDRLPCLIINSMVRKPDTGQTMISRMSQLILERPRCPTRTVRFVVPCQNLISCLNFGEDFNVLCIRNAHPLSVCQLLTVDHLFSLNQGERFGSSLKSEACKHLWRKFNSGTGRGQTRMLLQPHNSDMLVRRDLLCEILFKRRCLLHIANVHNTFRNLMMEVQLVFISS